MLGIVCKNVEVNVTFMLRFTKSIDRPDKSVYNNYIHWVRARNVEQLCYFVVKKRDL